MSLLPQIEGGYLVNQGMLLNVNDVTVDVVDMAAGRRAKKKYNYEPFRPKVDTLPNLDSHNPKRKLRSQSQEGASTGSDEESQKEKQSKKRRDATRSKSLAASDRPGKLSEESRSIFTKYADVAKAQQRSRHDENNNSVKSHSKSRSSDSNTEQHVRFNENVQESYPEVHIREARQLSPIPSKPVPGYLKQTQASGNKVKPETQIPKPPRTLDKINGEDNTDNQGASDVNDDTDTAAALRRPQPSKYRAYPSGPSHHERLQEERRRARMWRETASDPGNTEKSIHNDQVIKGRQSQNRRKPPNRHDERPRGADRGRRMQSLPSRKEGQDSEAVDRPVNSAPSKELPKSEGPMPKLNNLVTKQLHEEKESPKPVVKEKEKTVEIKAKEKTSPIFTPTPTPKKPPTQEEKPKTQIKRPGADSNTEPTTEKTEKKTTIKLPPDDHGPVHAPVEKEIPVDKAVEKRENFKYYATEKGPDSDRQNVEEPPRSKEPPPTLRLHTEKSIKTDKSLQRQSRDISPSKSPGRGRDISPSKSPGRGRDISPSKSMRRDQSPGKYLRNFDKAKTMTERTEPSEYTDSTRKKREVTIMDPKDVQREMQEGGVEGFPHEYEMPYHRRSKTFEEMTDEEKVDYFKQELKLRPEQIRELTFHPRVTEPKQIHRAYTGMETLNWSSKSARLKSAKRAKSRNAMIYRKVSMVPPSQRKSHMLSKLQGVVYRHINKVYGSSMKNAREKQFFERLADLQLHEYQKRYEMLAENEQKQLEMKYRQREQLRSLRKKFEDDAWRRFMTQYVTSKVLESEYRDRKEYGLPNDLHSKPHGSKSKRHIYTMTPKSRYRANRKKYANLFNFNTGPEMKQSGKPLKFEGFDTVYIDTEDEYGYDELQQGSPTKKRQDVQSLMEEAMDLLHAHEDDSDLEMTPRRDIRKQSEPAVRRYGRPAQRPPRKSEPAMRSHERPRHSMSRFKPYSEGRSIRTLSTKKSDKSSHASRSKPKPKVKTIRELYEKRNVLPGNRYKASEFNAMKQNLLKDHERMSRKQKEDRSTKGLPEGPTVQKIEQRSERTDTSKQGPPPPDIKQVKPPQGLQKTESAKSRVPTSNAHLDDPQTQVGIDYEREKIADEHNKPSPASNTTKTVTTVTTTTTTTTKTVSPDKKPGGTDSVAETVSIKQDRRESVSRRDSISSQRRASVPNGQPAVTRKSISRTPSMATVREQDSDPATKPIQRTPSRASIFSVRRRPSMSQPPRTQSRVSTTGGDKATPDKPVNGHTSRASIAPSKQSKETENSVKVDSQDGVINVADANTKTETPVTNGHVSNGSGGSPVTVSLGGNDGRVSPVVSMSNNVQEEEKPQPNRRPSVRDSQINLRRPSVSQSPTKSNQSRSVNEPSPTRKPSRDSKPQNESVVNGTTDPATGSTVDIKKSEHMHEVVTEVVNNQRKSRSPGRQDSIKPTGKGDADSTSRSRSVQGRASRASLADNKRKSLPAYSKDKTMVNGHDDRTMKREDYEKLGKERDLSKPSRRSRSRDKKGRKRSTSRSRERKRSSSRDKKRGKGKGVGKTRFPDIDNRPNSIAGRSPSRDNTKTKVSKDVKESVTEREVTPVGGADQWRDLVQKYMRQPSPKIGKADHRALLDNSFDTDDEDDDIFARAQKRYALSISDDDSV